MTKQGVFRGLPTWLTVWLTVAVVVVIWDASMVLLRPHTLPGGKLNWLYFPYNLYITIDLRYGDMEDSFGIAQAWLNVVEIFIGIGALIMNYLRKPSTLLVTLVVCTMTFWKTVLFLLMYTKLANGEDELGTDDPILLIFCFMIPNGVWILFPGLSMWYLCKDILRRITNGDSHGKQN
ncbi:uncharacterized protein [Amphiura filiformis]|uniref:uncharacterized protein n=1 Tax=Amphiura filiformis TaxID=82378 RepID=UPI003B212D3D